ncbi:L-ascorbate metabolism protein UlaG, beta-lactamase superfamily [Ekhidna lutea]|uniref:L-ascorbate metabolism protein UlaG, beta-lactamase superfamily n=1 Tax=Ekhidna lutea TaxID=447679 RepID=A0A239L4J2_EKHLU|nr:MBL fold metallo-hydrolase [Ekhidna lutea]SNT25361.1 L-ascorbate metabolism protein UlaG, beta-lactamase superfamily [Ekhidna lutea]
MKKILTLILACLYVSWLIAQQRTEADTIATNDGEVIIQPILHGTLVLSWNDQTIYIDPYGGAERFEGLADPTLILITDIHGDHLNQKTLDALDTERAQFITPLAVKEKLPEEMKRRTAAIENGQTIVFEGIEILAIPMYNLPETDDSRHPKGRGNGYILSLGDKRIYISGDTEDIPEMRNLQDIDVAFVCMNVPYTMDVDQAASAVIEFQPKIVYPFHYRGKGGLSDVESFKKQIDQAAIGVEVRLKNWYPK